MATTSQIPKDTDSLRKLQAYVWQMNHDRGFDVTDPTKKMLLLTEEVGELAKAVRKVVGMGFTNTTKRTDLEEELADVFIVLLGLSSLLEVDLYKAFAAKETKNRERTWTRT